MGEGDGGEGVWGALRMCYLVIPRVGGHATGVYVHMCMCMCMCMAGGRGPSFVVPAPFELGAGGLWFPLLHNAALLLLLGPRLVARVAGNVREATARSEVDAGIGVLVALAPNRSLAVRILELAALCGVLVDSHVLRPRLGLLRLLDRLELLLFLCFSSRVALLVVGGVPSRRHIEAAHICREIAWWWAVSQCECWWPGAVGNLWAVGEAARAAHSFAASVLGPSCFWVERLLPLRAAGREGCCRSVASHRTRLL